MEKIANEFITALSGRIPDSELTIVKEQMIIFF